jgi:hypothetical protein
MLTATAAAGAGWTEAIAKPEETPGQRPSAVEFRSKPSGSGAARRLSGRTIHGRAPFV